MPVRSDAALAFLASRRSVPPKLLSGPGPEGAALEQLLTLAIRVPDHGKLAPWRLIVLSRTRLDQMVAPITAAMTAQGAGEAVIAKAISALASPLIVAVILSPVASDKIPLREQVMSAASVCLTLLQAALAAGWGAAWLTGPLAEDKLARDLLALGEGESVAGLIHIGRFDGEALPDRPRPELADKVSFL
ncbi:nitroreductase [Paracoccus suum]|uniref:Putative NAD(P)H nitroreductase n=1 Tax=Paracoccus suum TaxID=2259340 RepID=A0A344PGV7_9RHOB|nr:nitroreductase family protein [Paracoccus suum]AXC48612.1 nitroreductase [Paracoccus suum]